MLKVRKIDEVEMNKTTLVIMAAGIGSRYGGGIKQLEQVGPSGEIIMDYSIHDAIRAGFNKIVFIIRHDLEKDFKEIIGNRIAEKIEVDYVYQEVDSLPEGFEKPEGRIKPWGTGQAILCCQGVVKEPFAVINADDFYGREAFEKVHTFLSTADLTDPNYRFCMAGFVLGNTLSEHGAVTRGVCQVTEDGLLSFIEETFSLKKKGTVAVGKDSSGKEIPLDLGTPVSMNMWGFTPNFLGILEDEFLVFLKTLGEDPLKTEFLLPNVVGRMVTEGRAVIRVLHTNDKWFGVTYQEDKQAVVAAIQKLVEEGRYPKSIL